MRLSALLTLALTLLAVPSLAQPADTLVAVQPITVSPTMPVVGQSATLRFSVPVDTVFVTYRPSSAVTRRDTIRLGGFESVKWTPAQAGVVQIRLTNGTAQNVSVRFARLPLSGVLILLAAGFILFGGATFAMRKLLSDDAPRLMPEDLPDT